MGTDTITVGIDYKKYFDQGISYEQYIQNFQDEIAQGDGSKFAKYLPQNWKRQSRLDRKFKVDIEMLNAIDALDQKLNWLVISEHWCGDASQINPIINKIAEHSKGKINLRFVYRDEDTALIDAHLTDGRSRSIPILIQLDESFNLMKTYGPRPAEAQKLVLDILADGGNYSTPLHTWYAKDKQKSLRQDFINFLK